MSQVCEAAPPEDADRNGESDFAVMLSRELKRKVAGISIAGARYLTDRYYSFQRARIRAAHQGRTEKLAGEPYELIEWMESTESRLEATIKGFLAEFAKSYAVGRWMLAQTGIGPVISAGLLATIDIRKAPTVGGIWRFGGLDPSLKWPGSKLAQKKLKELGIDDTITDEQITELSEWSGQKWVRLQSVWTDGYAIKEEAPEKGSKGLVKFFSVRPYNGRLKTICLGHLGESFNKNKNREKCFYGRLLWEKQAALWQQNLAGEFSEYAAQGLRENRVGKATSAYAWKSGCYVPKVVRACAKKGDGYDEIPKGQPGSGVPMLPPQQIYFRARRWAVKLFLSHLHHVMYREYWGKEPPAPFIFEHPDGKQHAHLIQPPLWPGEYEGYSLKHLYGEE